MIMLMFEKDDIHLATLGTAVVFSDFQSCVSYTWLVLLLVVMHQAEKESQLNHIQSAEFSCVRDQYCNHDGTESSAYQSSIDHRTNIQTRQSRRDSQISSLGDKEGRPDKGTSKQASFTEPCSAPLRGRYIQCLSRYTRPLLFPPFAIAEYVHLDTLLLYSHEWTVR